MIPISKEFKRLTIFALFILAVFQFTIYTYSSTPLIVNTQNNDSIQQDLLYMGGNFLTPDHIDLIINNQNNKNSISTTYKTLLQKYSTNINKFSQKEKCQLYFSELYQTTPSWSNGAFKDSLYNTDVFNRNHFFLKHKDQIIKNKKDKDKSEKKKNDNDYLTNEDYYRVEYLYNQDLKKTIETEQKFVDSMTNIRVFGQCYLNSGSQNGANFNDKRVIQSLNQKLANLNMKPFSIDNEKINNNNQCQDIESRIFPWLSRQLPIYQRWNGEIHWGIPTIDPDGNSNQRKHNDNKVFSNENCFLQNFKNSIHGKGIVLTGSNNEVPDLMNLIKLLRGLDNDLPIQIVHKGDISQENQDKLVKVARDNLKLNKSIFAKVPISEIPQSFRKQEIWFVNVGAAVKPEYMEFFNKFYMKFLAYFFNSFEEIVLMDSDAIPLIKPSSFFKLSPYKKSKTVFFKDRTSLEFLTDHDVVFFRKLLPTKVDENLFGIPKSTSKTLQNNLFAKKYRHSMEAGIIGINRKEKFTSLLSLVQIQLWTPANRRVWGDKELFWLSLSMVGDENYEFNNNDAVSVGTSQFENLQRNDDKKDGNDEKNNDDSSIHTEFNKKVKVCSSHPGHLSGDDNFTLLWINSGFKMCKKNTWDKDIQLPHYKTAFNNNATLLRDYYQTNLQIKSVLLPEDNTYKKRTNSRPPPPTEKYSQDFGWDMVFECESYTWCASELLNNNGELKNKNSLYIEYDDDLVTLYDYYGQLWIADLDENIKDDEIVEVGDGRKIVL